MLFHSGVFLVFFLIVLGLHRLPLPWTAKKTQLLVASWIFYGAWNPPFVLLLMASTCVSWFCAARIAAQTQPFRRKVWLAADLVFSLGILGFFKYGGFLAHNVYSLAGLAGIHTAAPAWNWVLPAGISFYTFQTLSYTLDVYFRRTQPCSRFLDFALFVAFFPQLVAGPIVRSEQFLPQLESEPRVNLNTFSWGILLLCLGLFQKVFLADFLSAPAADFLFDGSQKPVFLTAWTGAIAFTTQIFCDFAGYSNCAIGTALCLGFALPQNFHAPYASLGFSDFWQRWHISLSQWLRDYLYIPLGGSRLGTLFTFRNLMLTMLLGGLWHGAAWKYVIWGGMHGLLLTAEYGIKRSPLGRAGIKGTWAKVALILGTYLMICVTMAVFRAPNLWRILKIVAAMGGLRGFGDPSFLGQHWAMLTASAALVGLHMVQRDRAFDEWVASKPWWIISICLGLAMLLVFLVSGEHEPFIYFQF